MLHISEAITLLPQAATVCDEWVQTERIAGATTGKIVQGRRPIRYFPRTHPHCAPDELVAAIKAGGGVGEDHRRRPERGGIMAGATPARERI